MIKTWGVIFVLAFAAFWMTAFGQQLATRTPSAERRDVRSLPDNLSSLQQATRYLNWKQVRGFSRSLTHHRQLRISKTSNVFISETGAKMGQVDVVEVILIPLHAGAKTEFALYDPNSGKRITHYPDTIKFDISGVHGGSSNPAPSLCIACHLESKPLNALIPWTQMLEDGLKRARATGQGIRQDLFVPLPNDEAARDQIAAFNKIMQDQFRDRINDIREWMVRPTGSESESESDGASNGSQSICSETNTSSSAVVSPR